MSDEHHVARVGSRVEIRPRAVKDAVEPRTYLVGLLAARTSVPPQIPIRVALTDLRRGDALVVAVPPLGEILVDRGDGQPGDLRGASRAQPRAAQHGRERSARNDRAYSRGLRLAVGGQREVGHGGVPPVCAPLGLAMPDHENLRHAVILPAVARSRRAAADRRFATNRPRTPYRMWPTATPHQTTN